MKMLLLVLIVLLIALLCGITSENVEPWMINTTLIVGVLCVIVGAVVEITGKAKR